MQLYAHQGESFEVGFSLLRKLFPLLGELDTRTGQAGFNPSKWKVDGTPYRLPNPIISSCVIQLCCLILNRGSDGL
jgi:hypothetical protein